MHRDFRELLQRYPENLGNYMDDWWIATESTLEGVCNQLSGVVIDWTDVSSGTGHDGIKRITVLY